MMFGLDLRPGAVSRVAIDPDNKYKIKDARSAPEADQ
jgi:hypothetical protein